MPESEPFRWPRGHLWGLLLLAGVVAVAFHGTLASIVATWARSATYTHGFIVLPIALWLLWSRRTVLSLLSPRPSLAAIPALLALGLIWLVSRMVAVNVTEQLAVVAMFPVCIWLILGPAYLKAWLFPLAYLMFAVPMGSFLVAPLMELTADVTVALVRASGVPVYRDGLFFSLPTGHWSVVAACSGQRYLIASVTLGVLFAYLNYRRWSRRVIFVLASIVVPIAANGLRAYGIVMLGHLSDMTVAVGVDHLLYGWLFFALIMIALFAAGSCWRETGTAPFELPTPDVAGGGPTRGAPLTLIAVAGTVAIAAWPVGAAMAGLSPTPVSSQVPSIDDELGGRQP